MISALMGALVAAGIGILAGALTGLTGSSGVTVVVPLLNLALDLSIRESIGTSLLVDVIASAGALLIYRGYGNVDSSGLWIALGSVMGAQIGAALSAATPEWGLSSGFGVFLILTGLGVWRRKGDGVGIISGFPTSFRMRVEGRGFRRALAGSGVGFLIGVISGVFGAGGGIMFLITLLIVFNLPLRRAVGTSTLIMMVTASSGALGYLVRGYLSLSYGGAAGIGAVLGASAAAKVANEAPEATLRGLVGGFLIVLGVLMIYLELMH